MIVDSSAVIAILFDEPDRERITRAIEEDQRRFMSAATLLESFIVVEAKRGDHAGRELDLLLHRADVEIVPFDAEQSRVAMAAWRRFGKGRHPAALNFGDCFAYALSTVTSEPLLFSGEDFSKTDVASVELI
jgi:ribonuclease VapC